MRNTARKRLLSLALAVLLALSVIAPVIAEDTVIDWVLYTNVRAFINGAEISSYNVKGYTAVVVEDLMYYGFDVVWNNNTKTLSASLNPNKKITGAIIETVSGGASGEPAMPVYATNIRTYFDGELFESYNVGGRTIVYMDDLSAKYGFLYEWDEEYSALSLSIRNNYETSHDLLYETMYSLAGETAEVQKKHVPSWEEAGWYTLPNYFGALADQKINDEGYNEAVEYLEQSVKSYPKYADILNNKKNAILQRWYRATGCPIAIIETKVTANNRRDIPEVTVTFRNLTQKTIVRYDWRGTCIDAYGHMTSDYPYDSKYYYFGGYDPDTHKPGERFSATWTLSRNEQTVRMTNCYITAVAFEDGTIWRR